MLLWAVSALPVAFAALVRSRGRLWATQVPGLSVDFSSGGGSDVDWLFWPGPIVNL
jgi:hypothetical protein